MSPQGLLHLSRALSLVEMYSLSLLALLAGSALATPFKRFDGLSVKVTGPSSSVGSIEDLKFTAEVTNTGAEAVKVLKYNTILDNLPTRSFTVKKDGEVVPFTGIKLTVSLENNEEAFTTIESGQTVTVEHEVADLFDFATAGAGTFSFEPRTDLKVAGVEEEAANPDALSKVTLASQPIEVTVTGEISANKELRKNEKRAVVSCSNTSQRSFIDSSYTEAKALARTAASYVTSRGASDSLFQAYYKTNSASSIANVFNAVASESGSRPLSCSDPYGVCTGGVIAYTVISTTNIYFCSIFYNEVTTSRLCSGTTVELFSMSLLTLSLALMILPTVALLISPSLPQTSGPTLTTTIASPPKSTPALSANAEWAEKWLSSRRFTVVIIRKKTVFCLAPSIRQHLPSFSALIYPGKHSRFISTSKTLSSFVKNEVDNDAFNLGSYSVILPEEPYVFGVSHIKTREVPETIRRPPYAMKIKGARKRPKQEAKITLGGKEEEKLRESSRLAKDVREFAGSLVKVGVTTNEIDAAAFPSRVARGVFAADAEMVDDPNRRRSVNNVIVHGIPDDRPLEDGDILNIDVTVYLDGYHGDTSQTWFVGGVDRPGRVLWEITNKALQAGINACGPGKPFKGIGRAIHDLVKEPYEGLDFCISQQFSGHGISTGFHQPPWIWHHPNDEPGIMQPGHCFTIEPIIIQGNDPSGWIFPDGWAASTENCARSAQAEHTVLITEHGVDVLTE
uniref:Methionine aminopeptidase n=1 Tax=Moniliophthora roreri TaxID=221103 RepID=A0A0W0FLS9_MONRR